MGGDQICSALLISSPVFTPVRAHSRLFFFSVRENNLKMVPHCIPALCGNSSRPGARDSRGSSLSHTINLRSDLRKTHLWVLISQQKTVYLPCHILCNFYRSIFQFTNSLFSYVISFNLYTEVLLFFIFIVSIFFSSH